MMESTGSRRSTVSKNWRFQMFKQDMQADQDRMEEFQNYNQPAFDNWNAGAEAGGYSNYKQEKQQDEGGFDMKF